MDAMRTTAARAAAADARVARLATVDADGAPHLVPLCFALVGDTLYSAVDHKPKRSTRLRRVTNVESTGRASVLVDAYVEDWSRLWWVRLDGRGRVVRDADEAATAIRALREKYDQYAELAPTSTVLAIDIERWSAWSAG
jgi:PPOX class probable F420-dependent enzyme